LYGRWPVPGTDMTVYHKTTYDFKSIKTILENLGFKEVKIWNWREVFTGDNEGFDDYSRAYFPHMDSESGIHVSLNVEASKR